jgi:F-type H+-transporting ATPase subunit delta
MSIVTLRYAHAFGDVAKSAGLDPAAAQQQLADFAGTLSGSPELREFLNNPSIPNADKLRIVDAIGARIGFLPQVRNFVAVIMSHERLNELNEILAEYATVVDQQTAVSEADVTTARPLHEADRAELESRIVALAGGSVRTSYHQDEALLGGAVVRIGSTVYDGSVRAQLQQLKEKLVNA